MNARLISILLLCGALSLAARAAVPGDTDPQSRTISVTGTAFSYERYDMIMWTISLEDAGASVNEAKTASDQHVQTIIDALKQLGIPAADIYAGLTNIQGGEGVEAARAVKAVREMSVRQRTGASLNDMLRTLSMSARGKFRYEFMSSKMKETVQATLVKAVRAAKEKAGAMAAAADAKLGRTLLISEYPPAGWTVREDSIPVDAPTENFGADMQKVGMTVYAVFEIQ